MDTVHKITPTGGQWREIVPEGGMELVAIGDRLSEATNEKNFTNKRRTATGYAYIADDGNWITSINRDPVYLLGRLKYRTHAD